MSLPVGLLERIRADAERAHRPVSWQVALMARRYYDSIHSPGHPAAGA
ncbi:MAG: hypothetical protein ACREU3_10220 [Steroidobacteraceae bacterium]